MHSVRRFLVLLLACTALLVLAGCASINPVAPGTRAVILDRQQVCHYSNAHNIVTFPAGRYEPQFQTVGGVYYHAPSMLVLRDIVSATVQGGLFIPSDAEHKMGFWFEDRMAQTFTIIEPVVYRRAP